MTDAEKVVKEAMIRWEATHTMYAHGRHHVEVTLSLIPDDAVDSKEELLLSIETLIMECVGRLSGQKP